MYFGICCVCVCVERNKETTECGGDVVVLVIINHIYYNILEYSNIGLFIHQGRLGGGITMGADSGEGAC